MSPTPRQNTARPASAADRLRLIYGRPGPYTSVYLATRSATSAGVLCGDAGTSGHPPGWADLRTELASAGAPAPALSAIEARLGLPAPADTSAVAVIAAADGTTIVDHGIEPLRHDHGVVDALPYVAPLLEWDQSRIPHLIVIADANGVDVAGFAFACDDWVETHHGVPLSHADTIAASATRIAAELVVVAGPPAITAQLAATLVDRVPKGCRVVAEPDPTVTTDELAEQAVRLVADAAARTTVGYLLELRNLDEHDAAVHGTSDTIRALRTHNVDVLLIHDDPSDQRRIWIGQQPDELWNEPPRRNAPTHARLVDAAIRSAVLQGAHVHIIPATGTQAPADNTAALIGAGDRPPTCLPS